LKQRNIVRHIKAQRLAWFGHLEIMHEERTTKKITRWKPLSSRTKGRPRKKWEDVLQDLQIMKVKVGRRAYEGMRNGRKLLSKPRPFLGCRAVIEEDQLCWLVDLTTVVSLSSADVPFMKDAYLEDLLEA
jgi:hypothetical protein